MCYCRHTLNAHRKYTRIQCKLFWQNKPQYIQENNGWLLDILNVNSISSIQKNGTLSCLQQNIALIPFASPIQPEHNNINENFSVLRALVSSSFESYSVLLLIQLQILVTIYLY